MSPATVQLMKVSLNFLYGKAWAFMGGSQGPLHNLLTPALLSYFPRHRNERFPALLTQPSVQYTKPSDPAENRFKSKQTLP